MSKTKLIADSGSTKTDWHLIHHDQTITTYSSIGLNPYFIESKELLLVLQGVFDKELAEGIDEVHFYGAGLANKELGKPFEKVFKQHFSQANIHIIHDLLAAARALFKHEKGLAIILGTGSNSCLYDGVNITANIPALGFVLGDEGSGAHHGKLLLTKYIYNELDEELTKKLDVITSKNEILKRIYKEPFPNRFLASFSTFVADNIHSPQMYNLVKESLALFLEKHIIPYPNYSDYPIGIVGSIGYIYQDILQELTHEKGLEIKNIVRSPIESLVEFHL